MHGDTDTLSAMVEQLRRLQAALDARGVATPEAGPLVSLLSRMPSGFPQRRKAMVADLRRALTGSGATLEAERLDRVLGAMGRVPREAFMPEIAAFAYLPAPFEIGYGQTISHPQVVAAMSYAVARPGLGRVLDVGTGSGYQAAVLSHLAECVTSIEIVTPLAEAAAEKLAKLGFANVECLVGDACAPETLPDGAFDAIVVAAQAPELPGQLLTKLAPRGVLVMPVGRADGEHQLVVAERVALGVYEQTSLGSASFVALSRTMEGVTDLSLRPIMALRYGAPLAPDQAGLP